MHMHLKKYSIRISGGQKTVAKMHVRVRFQNRYYETSCYITNEVAARMEVIRLS